MLGIIKKILAILCTSVLFIPRCDVAKYAPKDADTIKLNAVIISDVHMEGNNMDRYTRFGKTLTGIFANKKKVNALVFAGDNTMNGQNVEWFDFYGMLCRYNKAENVLVGFGNHDFGNVSDHETYETLSKRCIKSYNEYLGQNIDCVYYSKEINGYKFIMLSSTDNAEDTVSVISNEEIEWLKNELKDSADKGMPAFVVNHNLIYGTNGIRSTENFNITSNDEALNDALKSCGTKVIYFSGHSHYGINSDTVNTEGNVTYINLPSAGNNDNYDAEGIFAKDCCGCVLEVYEDNITLRLRDFGGGNWIEGFDDIVIPLN